MSVGCQRGGQSGALTSSRLRLTPFGELLGQSRVHLAHQQDEAQVHQAARDGGDIPGLQRAQRSTPQRP